MSVDRQERAEIAEFEVEPAAGGERLDHYLRRRMSHVSRTALSEAIAQGRVRVNGRRAAKGEALSAGDRVTVQTSLAQGAAPDPELPLCVVHEDEALVVVDKPAGVPSHALRPGERGNIASALLARYPELAGVGHSALEPGLLHRLDNDTSGLLMAARDREAFERLRRAHRRGEIDKRYLALCAGQPPLGAARGFVLADRKRVRVSFEPVPGARAIESEIVASEGYGSFSLVEVRAVFAARHQVRAQLAALGHPIAGDALYGGAALPGLTRHFLHASRLSFRHPRDGRLLELQAELPESLRAVLRAL